MGAMAQVATQASTHGPTVVMPTVAASNGGLAAAPTVFEPQEAMARPPSAAATSKSAGSKCPQCSSAIAFDDVICGECGKPLR